MPDERMHLSADNLVRLVRAEFENIPDQRQQQRISLVDTLMAAYAIFALKLPSLLAFEDQRRHNAFNLASLFGLQDVPCDTHMRTILDDVNPLAFRPAFLSVFRQLQRGKALEPYVFWQGHYLIAGDGTSYHASENICCPCCLEKKSRNGVVTYYHQMLGLAVVHPDRKEVIPLCPEAIVKQDGSTKNDGERSATRRALEHFRREHPHLKAILVEDALSANAPHLEDLRAHNVRFLLGVKPGSHAHLFQELQFADEENRTCVLTLEDGDDTLHHFRWLKNVPLNKTHADVRVNLLDYWQIPDPNNPQGEIRRFTWITDLDFDEDSVYQLMRGGRARWRIENETFNTLKNQGYHFEHNFGHGNQYLSVNFALLMMLAFLVDQVQQLCDSTFQAALRNAGRKCRFWEAVRSVFHCFHVQSETLLNFQAIALPAVADSG